MSIFCTDKLGDPRTTRDKNDLLQLILVDMFFLLSPKLFIILVFIIYFMLYE